MIKLIIERKTLLNEVKLEDVLTRLDSKKLKKAFGDKSESEIKKLLNQVTSDIEGKHKGALLNWLISLMGPNNHIADKSSNVVFGDTRNLGNSEPNMSNDFSFDPNEPLSDSFKLGEFISKDSRYNEGEKDKLPPKEFLRRIRFLAKNLERIRAEFNSPVRIISGYRSPYKNKKVGGAKNSQHMQGRAADIMVEGVSSLDVFLAVVRLVKAGKIQIGGVGLYPKFVHIDVRPTGRISIWKDKSLDDRYLKAYAVNSEILRKKRNPKNSMIVTLDTLTNKVNDNTGEASESGVA